MIDTLAVGFVLSLVVALGARGLRLLTPSGVVAAVGVGTLVFGFGGWRRAALLVLFVATSSLLTRWQAARKPHPEHSIGRTGAQVLANGAVAAALAVWGGQEPVAWIATAYAGAIATATADTWATEIGLLSKSPPRLVTALLRPRVAVLPGTSGGVTALGTLAASTGAAVVAASSMAWLGTRFVPVWLAGFLGMTLDSVLGATVEGRWRWMTNDAVNLLATVSGAAGAVALGNW